MSTTTFARHCPTCGFAHTAQDEACPRTVSFPSTPGGPADITLTEVLPASYTLWRVNPDGTAIALADGTRGEMESAKTSCALGALPDGLMASALTVSHLHPDCSCTHKPTDPCDSTCKAHGIPEDSAHGHWRWSFANFRWEPVPEGGQ